MRPPKAAKCHYPRLAGSPSFHITLGSFKIGGIRDPLEGSWERRSFGAVADSPAFAAGMRKAPGTGIQPDMALVNRFTTAQSTLATRRRAVPAIVTVAAMAALAALTADAAARQARPLPTTEAKAPREAGEPIMAIVSIKSQQVTFYDADGWILRAPVSTGTTGRETPAGVFAIIEKQKDHHSSLYDDAWMPNMQRIT
jgi:L,D-transpeptidase catalytic domain